MNTVIGPLNGCVLWHDYRRTNALDHAPPGNAHPGTLYGGAALDATEGLQTDGIAGYLDCAFTTAMHAAAFSLGFWIKGASQDSKYLVQRLTAPGSNAGWYCYSTVVSGTCRCRMKVYDSAGTAVQDMRADATILDGTWHHVLWTMTSGSLLGYVDGVLAPRTVVINLAGDASTVCTRPIRVGKATSSAYFAGSVRRLRYWTRVLSAGEAAAMAAEVG